MHLVFAIDHLGSGGAQRQAVEIAAFLRVEAGLRVSFLVYRDIDFHAPRLREAGVEVALLPKAFRYDPRQPGRIGAWLRERRADVVHAFMLRPALWILAAMRLMRGRGRPALVAAERSSLIATGLRQRWTQRLVYRAADAVTANAESVAREITWKLGVQSERVHYIPNGIRLEDWDHRAAGEAPFLLEPDRFHLALVGGLRREKNHGLVLEALSRLPEPERADLRVWFIGAESGGHGVAEQIRREVDERGLGGIVRFEPPTRSIAAVMRRLDGIVLPSAYEGFPNVALEGMASGVPVIASPVGDVPNLLADGETGFVLERTDADALIRALRRLRGLTEDERAALGASARRVVEERYAMSNIARRHLALYEAVAPRRNGG